MCIINKIKKITPVFIKRKIQLLLISKKNNKWSNVLDKNRINILIFLSGFYQNLGDMAITYAQYDFLKDMYPEANIVTVPSTETYTAVKILKKMITPKDLITITGGGNMDEAYESLDEARLYIVKNFPRNKIVCFPQTMSYSNSKHGIKRKIKSQKIYNSHSNMTLFAREKQSYQKMKQEYSKTVIGCCPDIVLYLDKQMPLLARSDIMCCFRNDFEKNISNDLKSNILDYLKGKFLDVKFIDTVDVAIEDCTQDKYRHTLEKFWESIKQSRLVITDRLHCMIFCVITGTPCIAIDNSNHKIRGVYETWLDNIEYVKFAENSDLNEIVQYINELIELDSSISVSNLARNYEALKNACEIIY